MAVIQSLSVGWSRACNVSLICRQRAQPPRPLQQATPELFPRTAPPRYWRPIGLRMLHHHRQSSTNNVTAANPRHTSPPLPLVLCPLGHTDRPDVHDTQARTRSLHLPPAIHRYRVQEPILEAPQATRHRRHQLFHSAGKTTAKTLVERSRRISEISSHLHRIAHTYRIAVLVLNEVIDVIDRGDPPSGGGDMIGYRNQSRLFGRPDSVPGEDRKEAALGLVWANQVNVRVFLARTKRRRYLDGNETPKKRQSAVGGTPAAACQVPMKPIDDQPVLIRRLSVVFSSVAPPASCNYIVTAEGLSVIPGSTFSSAALQARPNLNQQPIMTHAVGGEQKDQVVPLDAGCILDSFTAENDGPTIPVPVPVPPILSLTISHSKS